MTTAAGASNPETRTVTITVPFDPALLSPNQRLHWAKRARIVAQARETAHLAWVAAGKPHLVGVVTVRIEVRRRRQMDDDNLVGGIKACRDALFNGAIVKADSPKWCRFLMPTQSHTKGPASITFMVIGDGSGPYSKVQ